MAKVGAGDDFNPSAADWNSFVDAADFVKTIRITQNRGRQAVQPNFTVVTVYNDSGSDLKRFEAVGISDVLCPPDNSDENADATIEWGSRAVLKVKKPVAADKGKWGVLLEHIPAGEIGKAAISGIVQCRVSLTATSDLYVDVAASNTIPVGGGVGFELAWVKGGLGTADATGTQLALVKLGTGRSGKFPVKVQKDGGSDGSTSSAASWTYTVRDLNGNTLGTGITLSRPRPKGVMIYQAGSSGYGDAFYDGSTLKLWDAGEVEDTGAC